MDNLQAGATKRFRAAYAEHRRREGRDRGNQTQQLPYVAPGPLQKMWAVRARSFETAMHRVVKPFEQRTNRPLRVVDLGAGNGWFTYRMTRRGHHAVAIDVRSDNIDGLGVTTARRQDNVAFKKVVADFTQLAVASDFADISVFNASFHYATSLSKLLAETVRVTRAGGRILIIDTPFYDSRKAGEQMVAEKKQNATAVFGDLARDLTAISFLEFLTHTQLADASLPLGIQWVRHKVRYPIWYELRPLLARLKGRRPPSRFDVWEGIVT